MHDCHHILLSSVQASSVLLSSVAHELLSTPWLALCYRLWSCSLWWPCLIARLVRSVLVGAAKGALTCLGRKTSHGWRLAFAKPLKMRAASRRNVEGNYEAIVLSWHDGARRSCFATLLATHLLMWRVDAACHHLRHPLTHPLSHPLSVGGVAGEWQGAVVVVVVAAVDRGVQLPPR